TVGSPAIISGPLLADGPLTTTVTFVSPSVDTQTRSVQVRMAVEGAGALRPGAFVQVEIRPQSARSAVVVPRAAVFSVDSMPTVFVPDGVIANRFIAREIETGPAVGDVVPVISGLAAGDRLVVSGGFLIKADLGKHAAKGCCDAD
ncbi:MAG: efflux RND transporter periplasmic adaptor subunit, partial [Planctomycetes bacterium]|nr:efflux RND transporter periplasmic adaptor subunit [Planctomycetota bacterium]